MSSPSSVGDEEAEEPEEEDEEEQGSGEVVGHWELWLGTADCELWEGTCAALEQLDVECMLPMPFSVRNSSRSMYCNWKRPPSTGSVRSHISGPRKFELEKLPLLPSLLVLPLLVLPPPLLLLRMEQRPIESSSRSSVRSLSGERSTI